MSYQDEENKLVVRCMPDAGLRIVGFAEACDLLILNMIGGTGGIDHPGLKAELAVKAYLEQGKTRTS